MAPSFEQVLKWSRIPARQLGESGAAQGENQNPARSWMPGSTLVGFLENAMQIRIRVGPVAGMVVNIPLLKRIGALAPRSFKGGHEG